MNDETETKTITFGQLLPECDEKHKAHLFVGMSAYFNSEEAQKICDSMDDAKEFSMLADLSALVDVDSSAHSGISILAAHHLLKAIKAGTIPKIVIDKIKLIAPKTGAQA